MSFNLMEILKKYMGIVWEIGEHKQNNNFRKKGNIRHEIIS